MRRLAACWNHSGSRQRTTGWPSSANAFRCSRLAQEQGVKEIRRLDDLIPLLFAHSNYKSYSDSFIKRRWDLMNRWLNTLSSRRVKGVDVDGVTDQDDWLEPSGRRTRVLVTSGTSGRNSFLPGTVFDRDFSLTSNFDGAVLR